MEELWWVWGRTGGSLSEREMAGRQPKEKEREERVRGRVEN